MMLSISTTSPWRAALVVSRRTKTPKAFASGIAWPTNVPTAWRWRRVGFGPNGSSSAAANAGGVAQQWIAAFEV